MKKMYLLLALLLGMTGALSAQNGAFNDFIEHHRREPGFTYAFLSKEVFEVVSKTTVEDKDWKKLHNVVQQIGSLSILAADSLTEGRALYKEARRLVPTDAVDEVLTVRDGLTDVRIWAREEEGIISDMVLLVGSPEEFVLICFSGAIDLGNLSELAALFDAETAQDLARASAAVAPAFRISPNPSSGPITLTLEEEQDAPRRISVTDQNGRQVLNQPLEAVSTQNIDLSGLPSGLYWLQLETEKGKIGVKQLQLIPR
ncbi:MAG: DUF4252 domain-containing protein [Saprospiraceae bacterium]|nr:DUF4252 domain-containing protein [Saprospiraceae bacterium]